MDFFLLRDAEKHIQLQELGEHETAAASPLLTLSSCC